MRVQAAIRPYLGHLRTLQGLAVLPGKEVDYRKKVRNRHKAHGPANWLLQGRRLATSSGTALRTKTIDSRKSPAAISIIDKVEEDTSAGGDGTPLSTRTSGSLEGRSVRTAVVDSVDSARSRDGQRSTRSASFSAKVIAEMATTVRIRIKPRTRFVVPNSANSTSRVSARRV